MVVGFAEVVDEGLVVVVGRDVVGFDDEVGGLVVVVGGVVLHCGGRGRLVVVEGAAVVVDGECAAVVVDGVADTVTVWVVVTVLGRGLTVIGGNCTFRLPLALTETLGSAGAVDGSVVGVLLQVSVGVGSLVSTGSLVGGSTVGNGSSTSGNGSLTSEPVSVGKGSVSLGTGISLGIDRSLGRPLVCVGQSSLVHE